MIRKIGFIAILCVLFFAVGCQGLNLNIPEEDIFTELIVFPSGGCCDSALVYYFVVKNDGTLISYYGVSRNSCHLTNGRFIRNNLVRTVRASEETVLDKEDFDSIVALANDVVENYHTTGMVAHGRWSVTLVYDGNIYGNSTHIDVDLLDLTIMTAFLSSLPISFINFNDDNPPTRFGERIGP